MRLFVGGTIVTMAQPQPAEALLEKDGVIAAVGDRAALTASAPQAEVIDLKGHALLPAFIDAHGHILQLAKAMRCADLSACHSFDEIVETLRAFARERDLAGGDWLLGFGYEPSSLTENAHPLQSLLDGAFPARPVLLTHRSGHMGVLSAEAMRQTGAKECLLTETAFFEVSARVPPISTEALEGLMARAQQAYLSHGIATAQEGKLDAADFDFLRRVASAGALQLDVIGYADIAEDGGLPSAFPEYDGHYRDRLKLGGYKLFLDGSPQGRTAWVSEPYLGESRERGVRIHDDSQVDAWVAKAQREGRQLLTHCNGDAAIEQLLRAYREPSRTRDVIIHAQLMRQDQLPRVKALGLMPSYFVSHTHYFAAAHLQNLGPQRAARISPMRSTQALGIPQTIHTDTPVLPPDPLDAAWCACNRLTLAGEVLGPEERLEPWEALRCITYSAAFQAHEEQRKGTLELGKLADMAELSENPLALPPRAWRELRVCRTYKEGRVVYQA